MKRIDSTPSVREQHPALEAHYIRYDPVSGYLHKFRLDGTVDPGTGDAGKSDQASATGRAANLALIVAASVAVGLLLIIGALTL